MKRDKMINNNIKISKILFILSLFLFVTIIGQMVRLSMSSTIDGINLKKFASNRNTEKEVLYAKRGNIYNVSGEPLAQNVDSYTVIAYLDPKRSVGSKKPQHVVDKEMTASSLSSLINMSKDSILALLNKSNLYQVELGPGGKGISEITKDNIEKLQLPGIDFIQTSKRYYPNNDFLSYTLGYAQKYDNKIVGEMGIEKYFNDYLKGKDGYLEYQKDLNGYRIPNTPEVRENQVDGMDIYLTIDNNIQLFVDRAVKDAYTKYNPEWMTMIVADAKTGKILGASSTPSFDPNKRDITSYLNPLVSYTYEPGSTMKIFTYMAAMEKGTYDGSKTYLSGHKTIGEDTIYDWNDKGWGTISYDRGFALSSNIGAANIMDNFINSNDLKNYLKSMGFGSKTGITLPDEYAGKLNFKYPIEIANAAYGQGITITPIQYIQALTAIANNGTLLRPYIVDKIVDPNTNKIIYQGKKEEIRHVASSDTINKIKDLMYSVINGTSDVCTGYPYKIDGYNIIGKTGTAQYVNPKTGKYYTDDLNYIRSFGGMFPKDNPEVLIYVVAKRPSGNTSSLSIATKNVINDIAKYLNIFSSSTPSTNANIINYTMPNLLNMNKDDAINILNLNNANIEVIGNGNKIINQYPNKDITINNNDKVFLVTNDTNILLPSMINWSKREALTYCNLVNLDCTFNGYGYVTNQSISEGVSITKDLKLTLDLATKVE
jgi:penicillin-binding protein 2B